MKKENGITLIALIITIIIMLILVGVTINFALNGGIINKAKQAAAQTQLQADREALFSAVVGSLELDGEVDFATLNSEVIKIGFTGTNGTYTSAAGNTFTVDEYGNITSASGDVDADLEYLKTALVNKKLYTVMEDISDFVFTDSNITLDADYITANGQPQADSRGWIPMPILYKGKTYNVYILPGQNEEDHEIKDVTVRTASSGGSEVNATI